jgi:hypothetical protein
LNARQLRPSPTDLPIRKNVALPFSRVIEVEPETNRIVWEYHDDPLYNFFSPYISGARRLPNGNTLITEGMFGRMQVTPEREVVWEYVYPHFHAAPMGSQNQHGIPRHPLLRGPSAFLGVRTVETSAWPAERAGFELSGDFINGQQVIRKRQRVQE